MHEYFCQCNLKFAVALVLIKAVVCGHMRKHARSQHKKQTAGDHNSQKTFPPLCDERARTSLSIIMKLCAAINGVPFGKLVARIHNWEPPRDSMTGR
jgi:hypothetical protein